MLIKYSANNLSKQVSQIDYMLEKKSVVLLKCSDIVSDQNVKLVGHIQNLVGQCPMTDCYFQLCIYIFFICFLKGQTDCPCVSKDEPLI